MEVITCTKMVELTIARMDLERLRHDPFTALSDPSALCHACGAAYGAPQCAQRSQVATT